MALEIVSFPMKNGGSFQSYVNVYQRVPHQFGSPTVPWSECGMVMEWSCGMVHMVIHPEALKVMGIEIPTFIIDDHPPTQIQHIDVYSPTVGQQFGFKTRHLLTISFKKNPVKDPSISTAFSWETQFLAPTGSPFIQ